MKHLSRTMHMLLAAVTAVSSVSGCSVKEDRRQCPCEIIFSAGDGVLLDRDGAFFMAVYESSMREQLSEYSWRQIQTGEYECKVTRGYKQIVLMDGLDRSFMYGTEWRIIPGNQADSIYVSVENLDCNRDEAILPLAPAKQFSTVFLEVVGADESYPYEFTVEGSVSGLDLIRLEPIQGTFRYRLTPWEGDFSQYRFRLPRQVPKDDGSLILNMTARHKEDGPAGQERSVVLPLGEMIHSSGHDWTKPSLDDIHIGIGHAEEGIEIRINEWMTIWEGDFTI